MNAYIIGYLLMIPIQHFQYYLFESGSNGMHFHLVDKWEIYPLKSSPILTYHLQNINHQTLITEHIILMNLRVLFVLFTDTSVRAALVQIIPDIFARCLEIGNAELEYFLFDRMLEIVLRFLKNEENMVSIKTKRGKKKNNVARGQHSRDQQLTNA